MSLASGDALTTHLNISTSQEACCFSPRRSTFGTPLAHLWFALFDPSHELFCSCSWDQYQSKLYAYCSTVELPLRVLVLVLAVVVVVCAIQPYTDSPLSLAPLSGAMGPMVWLGVIRRSKECPDC